MAIASIIKLLSPAFHRHNFIAPRCVISKLYSTLLKPEEKIKGLLSWLSPDNMPPLPEDQAIGNVVVAHGSFMRVIVISGSVRVELLCVVRAVLRKMNMQVIVGDQVLVRGIDWINRKGMIHDVFRHKNRTMHPPVANVGHLLVLFSFEQPKIKPLSLTTFLADAESDGIPVTLAINKAELVDEASLEEWKLRLRSWVGYDAVFCSVKTETGLDTLKLILKGKTTVIVGPSGVGKSSLINAIRGAIEGDNWCENIVGSKWLEEQRVGEVSVRNGSGKQTTTNVSLLPLPEGGFLADTPGFSQPRKMKCVGMDAEPRLELESVGMGVKHVIPNKVRRQSRKSVNQSLLHD